MPNEFHISVTPARGYLLVEVTLGGDGLMTADGLPTLLQKVEEALGSAGGEEPVIISGRLPVWAFSALTHLLHPRPWVGTFDPRLGGGVVVASHDPARRVGEVVPLE